MTPQNDTTITTPQQVAPVANKTAPSTGDSVAEYWVTRVVRQMKGCSPAKIDSVIQANLKPRKINWSQRPDTLEIPGLKGRTPYSIDNLPLCYELGYFRGDSLLHPELTVRPRGIVAEPLPYHPKNDNIIGSIILVCFIMATLVLNQTRHFISQQAHEFIYPSKELKKLSEINIGAGFANTLLTNVLLSSIGSLLFFMHAQSTYNLMLCSFSAYWFMAIYFACFTLYFVAKKQFSDFINWIFFDKTKRQQWRNSSNFLLICEMLSLVPITMVGIYFNLSSEDLLIIVTLVVTIFKLGLLFSTFSIFLPKFYGIMHLLSYLCALEIVPLISLWAILSGITDRLTITF